MMGCCGVILNMNHQTTRLCRVSPDHHFTFPMFRVSSSRALVAPVAREMLPSILSVSALVSPPVSARQLAAELSQFGLTVLKEPQLDKAQLEQVRQRCSARLSALLDEVQVQGGDPIEQHYTFSEIAHRQRLRWDLRLPEDDPLWRCACDAAVGAAMPVVEQPHPNPNPSADPNPNP